MGHTCPDFFLRAVPGGRLRLRLSGCWVTPRLLLDRVALSQRIGDVLSFVGEERWTIDLRINFHIVLNAGCEKLKADCSNSASPRQHRRHMQSEARDEPRTGRRRCVVRRALPNGERKEFKSNAEAWRWLDRQERRESWVSSRAQWRMPSTYALPEKSS